MIQHHSPDVNIDPRRVSKEFESLLKILKMKNLFFYKGGLCVRYSVGDFRSTRVEHNSLREFVWAYISQPRDGEEVLKLLIKFVKESRDKEPSGFQKSVKVSDTFLTLLGLNKNSEPSRSLLLTQLSKYVMEKCARIVNVDQLHESENKWIGEIIPDNELFKFLPPEMSEMKIPFKFLDLNKIIEYQVKLGKETNSDPVPIEYSSASMTKEEIGTVTYDIYARKKTFGDYCNYVDYPDVDYLDGYYWWGDRAGYLVKCYTQDCLDYGVKSDLTIRCSPDYTFWIPRKDFEHQEICDSPETWKFLEQCNFFNWTAWPYSRRYNGSFRPSYDPFKCDSLNKELNIVDGVLSLFITNQEMPSDDEIFIHVKSLSNGYGHCYFNYNSMNITKNVPLLRYFNKHVFEEISPLRLTDIDLNKTANELNLKNGDVLIYAKALNFERKLAREEIEKILKK